ncbi:TetR family transcriptional regulator [Bradyrhizobium centrolobii]|uniref:TetR family transcriptional regulator n=2 Tax=Bradyrhizobium centrolobii TaxID=1505087 RepID=A0A176YGU8_9BRAD|nr:TetR family transcriptional regulator [Bradyrhizobium centrolobii]
MPMDVQTPRKASGSATGRGRKRDRERTRQEILDVAFQEFAEKGLSGTNTDVIAARANITKRLVFYYFNTKEKLFTAVLEEAYAKMRDAERDLRLDELEPETAIRTLAEFTFDFDNDNPEFVRLVTIENIHRGRHLTKSLKARAMTRPIIAQIERVLARGEKAGVIRSGIDPVELHMTLSSLCFFSVANRHTFQPQFGYDMTSKRARRQRRTQISDLLWLYVRKDA